MFADLDESLRQLLVQRGQLDSGEVDIAFDMPTREWAAGIAKPTVNLYLYDIRENSDFRNPSPWTVRQGPNNTAIKSKPDIWMDLTYSVTAFANAVEDEHRLLSRVLITLLQHPILPQEFLQGQVEGLEIQTFTAQPGRLVQAPADYWGALDNDIKPSIDFRATLKIDLGQEIPVGLVLTSNMRVVPKAGANGNGASETVPFQIGGRVHRSDEPEQGIPDLKMTLLERGLDTVTDAYGRYMFRGVPEGQYTLLISGTDIEERREVGVPGENYDIAI